MSNNIEEDIKQYKELRRNKPIFANIEPDYFFNFVDKLLADRERLQSKANKYDALVEKIKEKLDEIKVPILIYGGRGNGRTYAKAEKEAKKYILQYLLNILEEGEKE